MTCAADQKFENIAETASLPQSCRRRQLSLDGGAWKYCLNIYFDENREICLTKQFEGKIFYLDELYFLQLVSRNVAVYARFWYVAFMGAWKSSRMAPTLKTWNDHRPWTPHPKISAIQGCQVSVCKIFALKWLFPIMSTYFSSKTLSIKIFAKSQLKFDLRQVSLGWISPSRGEPWWAFEFAVQKPARNHNNKTESEKQKTTLWYNHIASRYMSH